MMLVQVKFKSRLTLTRTYTLKYIFSDLSPLMYFGNDFTREFNVDFVEVDDKTICAIEIKERAAKPVPLNNKEKGREEFYVRRFASAKDLTLVASLNYI